ncbi:MAG: glycine cleavage system protein H [Anaerolineales bacterium]|nr:MAG: glycine cleavage system protein H [Anaerolineales bacterium]
MTEFLETTVDKFTFRVAADRLYNEDGMWVLKEDGKRVRIGLSDFLQQRSGDVAFAEIQPVGTSLREGDEIATIETIKVNLELVSPLSGEIVEVNPMMELEPEHINQDPYGAGWLAIIEAADWGKESLTLHPPQAYFDFMKKEAAAQAGSI